MIMQLTHHVVDCPTCGRPVEIQCGSLRCELACGHCGGRFVADQSACGQRVVTAVCQDSTLERANQLLRRANSVCDLPQTVVLVEQCDECFARLASDVEQLNLVVVRAQSAEEAIRLVGDCDSPLVIANRDLPGKNGWVLADELRLAAPHVEIWLYMPQASTYAGILALFVNVARFVVYGGDLTSLSDAIADQLAARCKQSTPYTDSRELAAA